MKWRGKTDNTGIKLKDPVKKTTLVIKLKGFREKLKDFVKKLKVFEKKTQGFQQKTQGILPKTQDSANSQLVNTAENCPKKSLKSPKGKIP